MSVRVVIGAQWGDEGKGKIVDLLSKQADIVARYQGGANAGHTLKFDDKTFVLHLIPSGIFHNHTICAIGNGTVIDPLALLDEIEAVRELGTDPKGRLFISETAHVILSYHKTLDQAREKSRGQQKIGTTGRGIGPAYIDKTSRTGVRMMDLLNEEVLTEKIRNNVDNINIILEGLNHSEKISADPIIEEMLDCGKKLEPYIIDTGDLLYEKFRQNKGILLEGAQGSLLDIDHGTYPYVTSSSPTSGGACTGTGLPPTSITHVMGIAKAYCTRVGNGPFPTELENDEGELIRKTGHEFGATTGRPRRCGWLDLVALKYAARINGLNELTITKLDVLDHFEEVKLCTDYKIEDNTTRKFPLDIQTLKKAKPIYKTFKGWKKDTRDVSSYNGLPDEVQTYLSFIEDYLEVKIAIVSTGPARKETILV
ncbi:MAG TPA: adenylosuccinate synthase [Balneolales bacterium]|nr:adenylosuccinate synthase [Balneolales bacterium]